MCHDTNEGYRYLIERVSVLIVTEYVFDSCCKGEQKRSQGTGMEDSLSMIFKYAIDAGLSGYSSKKLTP